MPETLSRSYSVSLTLSLALVLSLSFLVAFTLISDLFVATWFFILSTTTTSLLLLIGSRAKIQVKIPEVPLAWRTAGPFLWAGICVLTGLILASVPQVTAHIDPDSMIEAYLTLHPDQLALATAGLVSVGIIPGSVMVAVLFRNERLGIPEKMALGITLSFVFSTCLALAVTTLGHLSYRAAFAAALLVLAGLSALSGGINRSRAQSSSSHTFDISTVLLLVVTLFYVVTSYWFVLPLQPLRGLTSGDFRYWAACGNQFAYFGPSLRMPYVLGNVFIWAASQTSGLPPLYAYAGLQFLQIILPLSFYVFVKQLVRSRSAAAVATLVLVYANGVTAISLIPALISNVGAWSGYFHGNAQSFIKESIFVHVGAPGIAPLLLSPGTLDFALVFLATWAAYRYVTQPKSGMILAISSGVMGIGAFYTHSIQFAPVYFGILLVLLATENLNRTVHILVFFASSAALIEIGSRMWATTMSGLPQWAVLAVAGAIGAIILARKTMWRDGLKVADSFVSRTSFPLKLRTLWFMGGMLLAASLLAFLMTYGTAYFVTMWEDPLYTLPIQHIITKVYGIALPLAFVGAYWLAVRTERKPILLFAALVLIIFAPVPASLLFPSLLPPSLIAFRYASFLLIPFSALAGLALVVAAKEVAPQLAIKFTVRKSGRRLRSEVPDMRAALLVLVLLVPLLSQGYDVQLWVGKSGTSAVSEMVAEGVNWLNVNALYDAVVLPVSEDGYYLLTTLSSTKVLPLFSEFGRQGNFQRSWLYYLLTMSDSTTVLYALEELDVEYIFVLRGDLANLNPALSELFGVFQPAYVNDEISIYRTPEYLVRDSSSYVLVTPICVNTSNWNTISNIVLALGRPFMMREGVDLSEMREGNVYFVASRSDLSLMPYKDVVRYISSGVHVVTADRGFFETIASHGQSPQDVSESPLIRNSRNQNGSITLVRPEHTWEENASTLRGEPLRETAHHLSRLLPAAVASDAKFKPPYPPDLFQFTIPSLPGLRALHELRDVMFWDGALVISGRGTIVSERVVFQLSLPASKEDVKVFGLDVQPSAVRSLIAIGPADVDFQSAHIRVRGNGVGRFVQMDFTEAIGYVEVRNGTVLGTYRTETGETNEFSTEVFGLHVKIGQNASIVALQPSVRLSGEIRGNMMYVIKQDKGLAYFDSPERENSVKGCFLWRFAYGPMESASFMIAQPCGARSQTTYDDNPENMTSRLLMPDLPDLLCMSWVPAAAELTPWALGAHDIYWGVADRLKSRR